jgi:threonine dehydratase
MTGAGGARITEPATGDGQGTVAAAGGRAGITAEAVRRAAQLIAPYVHRTPLVLSHHLSGLTGGRVYLKLENEQVLRSFKIRGIANRVLSMTGVERKRGIVVASSGNHGAAASYAGWRWGMPVKVFVPETTPEPKLAKIRRYGAQLVQAGGNYDETHAAALDRLSRDQPGAQGSIWIDSCEDEVVIAGHGTIGLEIAEDLDVSPTPPAGRRGPEQAAAHGRAAGAALDAVLVPVGGGGLLTGIGVALHDCRPGAEILAVQTEACPALAISLREGVCHLEYPSGPSLCDALIGGIGKVGFDYAGRRIDRVVLAGEAAIGRAVLELIEHDQVLAEPSGAVGAAYIREHPDEFAGRTVVVVISGGNLDYRVLTRLLDGPIRS